MVNRLWLATTKGKATQAKQAGQKLLPWRCKIASLFFRVFINNQQPVEQLKGEDNHRWPSAPLWHRLISVAAWPPQRRVFSFWLSPIVFLFYADNWLPRARAKFLSYTSHLFLKGKLKFIENLCVRLNAACPVKSTHQLVNVSTLLFL